MPKAIAVAWILLLSHATQAAGRFDLNQTCATLLNRAAELETDFVKQRKLRSSLYFQLVVTRLPHFLERVPSLAAQLDSGGRALDSFFDSLLEVFPERDRNLARGIYYHYRFTQFVEDLGAEGLAVAATWGFKGEQTRTKSIEIHPAFKVHSAFKNSKLILRVFLMNYAIRTALYTNYLYRYRRRWITSESKLKRFESLTRYLVFALDQKILRSIPEYLYRADIHFSGLDANQELLMGDYYARVHASLDDKDFNPFPEEREKRRDRSRFLTWFRTLVSSEQD